MGECTFQVRCLVSLEFEYLDPFRGVACCLVSYTAPVPHPEGFGVVAGVLWQEYGSYATLNYPPDHGFYPAERLVRNVA